MAGGDNRLWILHELDIIDKHHELIEAGVISPSVMFGGNDWDFLGRGQLFKMPILGLLAAETPILRDGDIVFSVRNAAENQFDMLPFHGVKLELVFGHNTPCPTKPVLDTSTELISHARDVISTLS